MRIRLWVQTGSFAGLSQAESLRRIKKSCDELSQMFRFTFEFVDEQNKSNLRVYWANNAQFIQRFGFNAMGVAKRPGNWIWLNNEIRANLSETRRYIETVFHHEFGHTRGFKHSEEDQWDKVMHWAAVPPAFPAREAKDWQKRFRPSGQNFYVVSKQLEAAKMQDLLKIFNPLIEQRKELLLQRNNLMAQNPIDWKQVHIIQAELNKINPKITELSPKIAHHYREWWRLHREWTFDPKVEGAL